MRVSLFSDREIAKHKASEIMLVERAKAGNMRPLLEFWEDKRRLFVKRSFKLMNLYE